MAAPGAAVEPRRTCTGRFLTWGWGSGPASVCRFSGGPGGVEPRLSCTRKCLVWGGAAVRRALADLVRPRGWGGVEPRRTCTRNRSLPVREPFSDRCAVQIDVCILTRTFNSPLLRGSGLASACARGVQSPDVRAREGSLLGRGALGRRILANSTAPFDVTRCVFAPPPVGFCSA